MAAGRHPSMDDLPGELLAEILRRLPPRSLAASRSVCTHWRTIVDAGGLLLAVAHLLPRSLCGIFINYVCNVSWLERSLGFFSRTARPSIDGMLSFLPGQMTRSVLDSRNGLLLYAISTAIYVCNPATRRWATLPTPPGIRPAYLRSTFNRRRVYLMFDPTVSLHYHVLFFSEVPKQPKPPHVGPRDSQISVLFFSIADYNHERDALVVEWPPYMYPVQVFSSKTGQWEDKQFIREGDAAVKASDDVWSDGSSRRTRLWHHAVYWQGSFYIHCDTGFIMRLLLEEQKYLVIKTPRLDTTSTRGYLGKSKHGVYYTAIHGYQIHVWVLCTALQSRRTPEWELKHQVNIEPMLKPYYNRRLRGETIEKCWILHSRDEEVSEDTEDYEWDSGDDSVVDAEGEVNMDYKNYNFALGLLGYHPYKEIVFIGHRYQGFAYYLDNSKLQYLGSPYPSYLVNRRRPFRPTLESFIYTPCMDDLLPIQNHA